MSFNFSRNKASSIYWLVGLFALVGSIFEYRYTMFSPFIYSVPLTLLGGFGLSLKGIKNKILVVRYLSFTVLGLYVFSPLVFLFWPEMFYLYIWSLFLVANIVLKREPITVTGIMVMMILSVDLLNYLQIKDPIYTILTFISMIIFSSIYSYKKGYWWLLGFLQVIPLVNMFWTIILSLLPYKNIAIKR